MLTFRTLLRMLLLAAVMLLPATGDVAAQSYKFRAANLIEGSSSVDVYLNNGASPYISALQYEYVSAQSGNLPVGTGLLNLAFPLAGQPAGSAALRRDVTVQGGYYYTALAYGTTAAPKLALLARRSDQVPTSGNALLRVVNATTVPTAFDVYLDSVNSVPIVTDLKMDSASEFATVIARSATLIITSTGSTTPLARLVAPIADRASLTMVISGTTTSNLVVHAFNGLNTDLQQMSVLQPKQGEGAEPTLRVVNALAQAGARRLDVMLNGTLAASGVNYRSASGILSNVTDAPVTLRFTPENQPADSIYGTTDTLARDTAYALVLTQFSGGAAVSMMLTRSLSMPAPAAGTAAVRFANAYDFRTGLTLTLTGTGTHTFSGVDFLGVSDWQTIPAGATNLQVFAAGIASPIFQGSFTIPPGEFLTLLAIGDETRFTIDVLRENDPAPQQPLASFGEVETGVRPELAQAACDLALRPVPNPFVRGDGHIEFTLAGGGAARVELFDMLGRRVALLLDGDVLPGAQSVRVPDLAPGAYTCVLTTPAGRGAVRVVAQ